MEAVALRSLGQLHSDDRAVLDDDPLVDDFRSRAAVIRHDWPRAAAELEVIAESYEQEARRHYDDAALEELDSAERDA